MIIESRKRTVIKTLLYRLVTMICSSSIVLLITGQWMTALVMGGIDALVRMCIYYAYERWWTTVNFGRIVK